ncbi:MAG: TolB family protein, partial [Ilumatobacteraceae bacterium]
LSPPDFTDLYTLSPDGTQVVYDCSTSVSSQICRFRLDTGEAQPRVTAPRPFSSFSWSPDGTQIVAGGSTGAQDLAADEMYEDLFVFGADGSGMRALPQPGEEANPAWSPDGKKIVYNAYVGSGSDTELGLWMMNADGTGATLLLNRALRQPDWTAQ